MNMATNTSKDSKNKVVRSSSGSNKTPDYSRDTIGRQADVDQLLAQLEDLPCMIEEHLTPKQQQQLQSATTTTLKKTKIVASSVPPSTAPPKPQVASSPSTPAVETVEAVHKPKQMPPPPLTASSRTSRGTMSTETLKRTAPSQKYLQENVPRFFNQLTIGCKKSSCQNPFCATFKGQPMEKNEAAAEALRLAVTMEDHFCK